MLEILINTTIDFGLYSLLVLIYTLVGAYQNINIWQARWDWKKWINGFAKWLLLGFVLIGTTFASFLLIDQANKQGVELINAQAVAPRVILGVILLASATLIAKIISKLAITVGVSAEQLRIIQEKSVNIDPEKKLILEISDLPKPSKEYLKKKLEAEQIGGLGAVYSVPTNSYEAFRSAVINRGYDIDGAYSYQCWDGVALLWQQLGQSLVTGNGAARGCWELNRDRNANPHFDLIFDKTQIKRGDVLFFGGSKWGHVGFADENFANRGYISVLGQNQRGNGNGYMFTIDNISLGNFLGAMRFKKWDNKTKPQPQPKAEAKPATPQSISPRFSVGDVVVPTELIDYNGTPLVQYDPNYAIIEINGDRAVLSARGQVWAALNIKNIRKI